jgi:hypothetical protein
MRKAIVAMVVLSATPGCGAGLVFKDQPAVWRLDDTRSIAEPKEREYLAIQYFADAFGMRTLERALELRDREPAWNANALEEVPDSTWFTNRIGLRAMTAEEVARGPALKGPPRPPYTIKSGKSGGGALGFIIEDADGRKFLVKFDRAENPEMQTGTNVVVNRLFWAFGYNVPSDYVFELARDELSISKKATAKDRFGNKIPYTAEMLDAALSAGPPPQAGRYRATASEYLSGVPKGGFPMEGVRADDPNDVIPHEHRRELRGLRVLAAWLNHTDMKEDNTLDMYVTEGSDKFLRHYFVDFGEALGAHGAEKRRLEDGYEYYFDWENQGKALVSLGLWTRPWENLKDSGFKSLGVFSAEGFDPTLWREAYPYFPFSEMARSDAFWGAKIVTRFTREQIEAVASEARFTEPGATAHLVEALMGRRLAIGRTWLEALSPLDALAVEDGRLCATDLGVAHGIVKYGVLERLGEGDEVAESADVGALARACVTLPKGEGYAVVRLRSRRGDTVKPALEVHLMLGPGARVLGLVRDP